MSDNAREHVLIGDNYDVEIVSSDTQTKALLVEKVVEIEKQGHDRSLVLADLGHIIQKHKRWERTLPRVKPYYAVKCNSTYPVLKILSDLGVNFECSSQAAIMSILELNVHPSRIAFSNIIKPKSSILYAAQNGIELMTFDNEEELHKIKSVHPTAKLLLRLKPEGTMKVKVDLSKTSGCFADESQDLLLAAKLCQLDVVGVSFNMGSGCEDSSGFHEMIRVAREVFNMGFELGFKMTMLDIGGGFPGTDTSKANFEEMSSVINKALDTHFPEKELYVMAESGRYFVASAFTLATHIMGKRTVKQYPRNKDGHMDDIKDHQMVEEKMYYINDGVFQSFMYYALFHAETELTPFALKDTESVTLFKSTLWGSTCANVDCIMEGVLLPDLHSGDWMYFPNMGAYTSTMATTFNGMLKPMVCYFCRKDAWATLNSQLINS
ncbi:hypothetical protein ACJMK2_014807 [Sinanodonta woodiana]|uniref:ornithine decarboxylase n=1 Tax=Sinanodonta woodiana TaxID=1069815 RepID=A0ABD3V2F6_SINWO